MTDLGWRLVEGTAQLLELREREAVLGDLAEAGASAWRGVLDVAGLAFRRQVLLWKSWRPWVAALGVALPGSFSLMGFSLLVSGMFREILGWNSLNGRVAVAALTLPLMLICRVLLLAIWAWSGGFVVGAVSRRTLWVSVSACFAPCLFCFSRFRIPSQSPWELLLFVLPAIWGVWQGVRGRPVTRRTALTLAITATALAIPGWTGPWIFILALIWPGWYLAAASRKRPFGA
jgi:hypothetical protein